MDKTDRTYSTSVEIADHLLPVLRSAAEQRLERACDNAGEWSDEIRAAVLAAAGLVEVFDLGSLAPERIAQLADDALTWAEPPAAMPTTIDAFGDLQRRLTITRDLIELRDQNRPGSHVGV